MQIDPLNPGPEQLPQITVRPPGVPDPVSIDTTPAPSTVNIDAASSPALPSPDTSTARAFMTHFGLGNVLGKSISDVHDAITTGHEPELRSQAASTLDAATAQLKQNMVRSLSNLTGKPLDPSQVNNILVSSQPTDPSTVSEQAYGHTYVDTASTSASGNMNGTEYSDARNEIPQQVADVQRDGGEGISRRQYAITKMQDVQDNLANQGWAGYLADTAKTFVPGYDEFKLRGWMQGTSAMSGLGLGNNLDEETANLLALPFPEYKANLDRIVDKLKVDNPQMAAQFLQAVLGQSNTDRFLNNLTTAIDLSSIPGTSMLGKALLRKAALRNSVADTAKNIVKQEGYQYEGQAGGFVRPVNTPDGYWYESEQDPHLQYLDAQGNAANGAGDFEEAGTKKAAATVLKDLQGKATPREAVEALTSNFRLDAEKFAEAPGAGGQNIANRITTRATAMASKLIDTIKTVARVDRLPEVMANEVVVKAIGQGMKTEFRGVANSVSDVVFKGRDPISNTYSYDLKITQPDGTQWKNWIQAKSNANLNGFVGAQVVKDGMGYHLIITKPLDEGMKVVRDLLGETTQSKLQPAVGNINGTIGWLRTPKELLSLEENDQREIATHAPSVLLGLIKEDSKEIQAMPKGLPFTSTRKAWHDWWDTIDYARHAYDPETKEQGYFFSTGQEMDNHYLTRYDRLPSDVEKEAYFAFKRNVETDRVFRAISLYSKKAQWGAQQHQLFMYDSAGKRISSDWIEGKIHPELPGGTDTFYVQTGKSYGQVMRRDNLGYAKAFNTYAQKIKSGEMKVMEIWNPEERRLENYGKVIGDAKVRYVITDKLDTKGLDFSNQLPRRGGGHFVYNYDHYIKQANVRSEVVGKTLRNWYEGDTTVMPMAIRAAGKEVVKHLNTVREFLANGDEASAKDYNDKHLPIDWKEHKGWYEETKDGDKRHPPRLNLKEPFYLVPQNRSIKDIDTSLENRYPGSFKDGTLEGNAARQHMVEFTGPRDAHEVMTLRPTGTRKNPLYSYEPAKMVDPITTMNRALNGITKSFFMDDLKAFSVSHWLKEAAPYLDIKGGTAAMWHSPYHYFNNAEQYWKSASDKNAVNILKAAHHMISQFNGVPNEIETSIHSMTQGMADMIYKNAGPKVVPDWMLSRVTDPAAYLRSMVVHMKLGMFNIPAFFVQASTHVNIYGIAGPKHAMPGTVATILHTYSRINRNPAILQKMDEIASNFGWRPGEWLEANQELANRGFRNVGHDYALVDAPYTNKVITTKWGQFLNAGMTFFKEGAESVRTAAWYTAHHEFRDKNPTGAVTKRDWDRIQGRAGDLDHNMSRAANSRLQSGLMSFPMQFNTYAARLAELMTGKRLTPGEKTRLFMTTSIMYGLPFGGIGLSGLPMGNLIKQQAQQSGYVVGNNWVEDVLMGGLPDAVQASITGVHTNISERYGTHGLDPAEGIVFGSEPFWKIAGGAAASTFANTFENSSGLVKAGMSFIADDNTTYPITADDLLHPFDEISEFSNIRKFLWAINTGHSISKNGTYLSDVSKTGATIQAFMGLTEQRTADIHNTYELEQAQKENEKWGESQAIVKLHRYFQAMIDNDHDNAEKYMQQAKSYMDGAGYPINMRHQVWAAAIRGFNTSLLKSSDYDYLMKNTPPGTGEQRRNTFRQIQGQK